MIVEQLSQLLTSATRFAISSGQRGSDLLRQAADEDLPAGKW
jgi:hypothetical protein